MKETVVFYMLPSLEFDEGKSLHLSHTLSSFLPLESAIAEFYSRSFDEYQTTYTAGHYGEESHQWTFSHHEVYQPENPELPTMVILRYKPSHF